MESEGYHMAQGLSKELQHQQCLLVHTLWESEMLKTAN